MLHITRREWESVHVSGEADILVRRIGRGRVELSIAAPAETRIVRSDAKRREPKRPSAGTSGDVRIDKAS